MKEIKITIKYFAVCKEKTNIESETLIIPENYNLKQLKELLCDKYPSLQPLISKIKLALNMEFENETAILLNNDEVALIPPVAGGEHNLNEENNYKIVNCKINNEEVLNKVKNNQSGAIVQFIGIVRDFNNNKQVIKLKYEDYTEMALIKMKQIGDEIKMKWPNTKIAITHRIGTLNVGETAVVIAVSSPHRAESFLACEYSIERIKEIVPIWKKEFYSDNSEWIGIGS